MQHLESIEHIQVILDEQIPNFDLQLDAETSSKIESLVRASISAKALRSRQEDRYASLAIAELLESPRGLTVAELLGVTESNNILSLISRIRKHLKSDNIYTLRKTGRKGDSRYMLIRRVSDNDPLSDL